MARRGCKYKLRFWQVYRRADGRLFGRYSKGKWRRCAGLLSATVAGADYVDRWVGPNFVHWIYYFN